MNSISTVALSGMNAEIADVTKGRGKANSGYRVTVLSKEDRNADTYLRAVRGRLIEDREGA
jgi:hypothetical protein